MVDIQNATLAGGVAVGSCADFMIQPWGAILIGYVGGMLSSYGFAHISTFLNEKIGLHDTCGIHNLHGMPGLFGAIVSGIAAAVVNDNRYNSDGANVEAFFPGRSGGRGDVVQGGYQVAATFVAFGIGLFGGLAVGAFLKSPRFFKQPEHLFSDAEEWVTPAEEIPLYHVRAKNLDV